MIVTVWPVAGAVGGRINRDRRTNRPVGDPVSWSICGPVDWTIDWMFGAIVWTIAVAIRPMGDSVGLIRVITGIPRVGEGDGRSGEDEGQRGRGHDQRPRSCAVFHRFSWRGPIDTETPGAAGIRRVFTVVQLRRWSPNELLAVDKDSVVEVLARFDPRPVETLNDDPAAIGFGR